MHKLIKPFFIKVITPLHAGSGQDLGIVDLPIQRERHTGFPKIEASGLKGSIREIFESYLIRKDRKEENKIVVTFTIDNSFKDRLKNEQLFDELKKEWKVEDKENNGKKEIHYLNLHQAISLLFGPENSDKAHAGALGFTDARILLFPVKSAKGVFAWTTCPKVLKRFKQDMALAGENLTYTVPQVEDGECLVTENSKLVVSDAVILEEYAFKKKKEIGEKLVKELLKFIKIDENSSEKLSNFAGIDRSKIVILSDDDFEDFVNLSTEVITRTRIDNETGTVKGGALFTEEYLPSETIMYSLALANAIFNEDKGIFSRDDKPEEKQVLDFWRKNMPTVMQIGGNATIGKGIVEIFGLKEAQNENNK